LYLRGAAFSPKWPSQQHTKRQGWKAITAIHLGRIYSQVELELWAKFLHRP
jgi:hypothetical protein